MKKLTLASTILAALSLSACSASNSLAKNRQRFWQPR